MKNSLELYPESLFLTRKDSQDPRLADLKIQNAEPADFIFWGYPDDEGIRLNGGRPGAALAPLKVREIFYKMTPPLNEKNFWKIFDAGFLPPDKYTLEQRHEAGRRLAAHWTEQNKNWVTLGGGHDYGYSDAAGFIESSIKKNQRPLVINFDAHLDVRPLDRGLTSGTPFFRVLEEFKNSFDFIEVGIQPHCNARGHLEYVKKNKGQILTLEEIRMSSLLGALKTILASMTQKKQPVFISLDIDVFSSSEAPGCSQSWPVGLQIQEFFEAFKFLIQNLDIKALGLYEVSPGLDSGLQTQRLAALVVYEFMQQIHAKGKV